MTLSNYIYSQLITYMYCYGIPFLFLYLLYTILLLFYIFFFPYNNVHMIVTSTNLSYSFRRDELCDYDNDNDHKHYLITHFSFRQLGTLKK